MRCSALCPEYKEESQEAPILVHNPSAGPSGPHWNVNSEGILSLAQPDFDAGFSIFPTGSLHSRWFSTPRDGIILLEDQEPSLSGRPQLKKLRLTIHKLCKLPDTWVEETVIEHLLSVRQYCSRSSGRQK